jgi:hypothetical protein
LTGKLWRVAGGVVVGERNMEERMVGEDRVKKFSIERG